MHGSKEIQPGFENSEQTSSELQNNSISDLNKGLIEDKSSLKINKKNIAFTSECQWFTQMPIKVEKPVAIACVVADCEQSLPVYSLSEDV